MDVFTYLILMVASVLISTALAPKPLTPEAATFEDFDFPQVEEGTPQSVPFGDCWTGDWQVLAYGDLRTRPVTVRAGK